MFGCELSCKFYGFCKSTQIIFSEEKKCGRQISQIKSAKGTKIQELNVLNEAIAKVRETDEDEVKLKIDSR